MSKRTEQLGKDAFGLHLVLPYFDRGAFIREPREQRPSIWLSEGLARVQHPKAAHLVQLLKTISQVNHDDLDYFSELRANQNSFEVSLAGKKTVVLCKPDLVKSLLERSPSKFESSELQTLGMEQFQPLALATTAQGKEFDTRRLVNTEVLQSSHRVHCLGAVFLTALGVEADRLRTHTGVVGWGQIDAMCREVALQVVWGEPDRELFDHLEELMRHGNLVPILNALMSVAKRGSGKVLFELFKVTTPQMQHRILRALPARRAGALTRGLQEPLRSMANEVIKGRFDLREALLKRLAERLDDPAGESLRSLVAAGFKLDNYELANQLSHWLFSMRATLGSVTAYALALLASHPNEQRAVMSELRTFASTEDFNYALLSETTTSDFPMLEGAIFEASRLFPVTPILLRKGTKLSEKDPLPVADQYLIHMVANNRNPEFVGTQYDPHTFVPQRWGEREGPNLPILDGLNGYGTPLFGGGGKECPGKNISLLLIKSLVGQLLLRYEFVGVENQTQNQGRLAGSRIPASYDQFGIRLRVQERR